MQSLGLLNLSSNCSLVLSKVLGKGEFARFALTIKEANFDSEQWA